MSETTDTAAGGRRGGRTVSKSTPDEVMGLACGLPLTRSVLRSVVADATPGQLGVLADLFRAENASRMESRRARLIRSAGFPCVKGFDGYDWGMASFPADWGREQLMDLGFVDRAEDLVLYGDVGCGKTHMAIATGMLACERGMPVRFFTASSLVMRLRRARDENRLDAELRTIGRARLLVVDELGYLPIDIDGARLLFQVIADSYEKRSVVFTTNLEFGRWGEPAVEVQAGRTVPEIRDGLVPSLVHAGARARAVARVRQSGHDRRHGDDAGVRRLVEGHGSRGGLHEGRSVVLVWFHDR